MDTEMEEIETPAAKIQVETLVNNVLERCQLESECSTLGVPINCYIERTSYYTGLPSSYVRNLQRTDANVDLTFDVFERMLVMKSLLKCYSSRHSPYPKLEEIYESINESLNVQNVGQFYSLLTQMGFDYRKTTNGYILAEDMKFTFERFNYLKKIRKCKIDKTIYYVDERVIDESLTFQKPDFDKISDTEDATHLHNGYYFYHVFSNIGLKNYLFTNKKSKDTYRKWFFDILLKVLKPGSVIVIDNHPLHGELIDETITRYHSKSDMISWLKKNNIPFVINMHKAELYELISKCNKVNKDYNFDKILKSHGFDVIRLPFGCRNMSPSSLLWKELASKKSLGLSEFSSPLKLEENLIPTITSLYTSSWKKLEERITYWEEQFIDIDLRTENILENICTFDVSNLLYNGIA